jgi:GNAT superfamily N-acetyltransferase
LYTQNLSLFAKLFLETKSVFYDTTTFLYYTLLYRDPANPSADLQVVGFFSKEKLSWDNNNLACILVFPPWQKRGFGQVLMGVSYELGKREGRLGGPEKPLSELGRQAYVRYWSGVIARYILSLPSRKTATVQQICDETYILQEDIVATLKEMGILELRKKGGASAVINKARVREWAALHHVSLESPIDLGAFRFRESTEEEEREEEDDDDDEDEEDED